MYGQGEHEEGQDAKPLQRGSGGSGSGRCGAPRLQTQDSSRQDRAEIQEGIEEIRGPPVHVPRIVGRESGEEFNRGECPGIGQALPQMFESEVLPYVGALDQKPGKVILEIHADPRRKAHDKAQREPQDAPSPEYSPVVPEPKP